MEVKYFSLTFLFLGLLSCNQQKKNPGIPELPEKKDTITAAAKMVNPDAVPDVSPMDMIYFPADYTKLKMAKTITTPPVMRVIYSRPHLNGRKLFHNVQRYGEYWRLGANEATEIQFYQPVTIQGKKINPGRYILYCIPRENSWTIFLNTNTDTWGLRQDSTKNIQQFEIPASHNNPYAEYFTMLLEKTVTGASLIMAWDDTIARLPIDF
jgi:hypothetical protein